MTIASWQDREILPRYAFLESILSGRRVLEIGAVALTGGRSAKFLLERGAAHVVAIDADTAAVEAARADADLAVEDLEFRPADFAESTEAYDVVLVTDGADLDLETDPGQIDALKSWLCEGGRLVLAFRAEGPALAGYDAAAGPGEPLVDKLTAEFAVVERATQTALVGYTLGMRDVDLPTALDESLAEHADPAYVLFLCGAEPSNIEAAALLPMSFTAPTEAAETAETLPPEPPAEVVPPAAPPAPPPPEPLSALGAEIDHDFQDQRVRELQQKLQGLFDDNQRAELATAQALAERDHLRSQLAGRAEEVERERAEIAAAIREKDEARQEAASAKKRVAKLEKDLAEAREAVAELERLRKEHKALSRGRDQAHKDLRAAQDRAVQLEQELAQARERAATAAAATPEAMTDALSAERVALDRERRELVADRKTLDREREEVERLRREISSTPPAPGEPTDEK